MIFDTHAHYDDKAFDEDREEMLASLPENGIGNVVNVCASINSLRRIIPLTEKYPYVWGAAGVHPDYAEEMTEETLEEIRKVLQHEKILAVGEIGLDYYWHKEPENHKRQQEMFRAQMDIGRTAGIYCVCLHHLSEREAAVPVIEDGHVAGEFPDHVKVRPRGVEQEVAGAEVGRQTGGNPVIGDASGDI